MSRTAHTRPARAARIGCGLLLVVMGQMPLAQAQTPTHSPTATQPGPAPAAIPASTPTTTPATTVAPTPPKPLALNAIGRLFLTPAQRERAALIRRPDAQAAAAGQPAPSLPDGPSPTVAAAPAPPTVYTVQGIVMRGDGTASLWLNGRRLDIPPGQSVKVDDVEIRLKSAAEAQIYVRQLRQNTAAPVGQAVSTPGARP